MDPHSSDGQAAVVVAEPPAAVPVAGLRRNWRNLVVRIALTAAALVVWFWTQSLIGARSLPASGIGDGLLSVTSPLNQYLRAHPSGANALLIVSSAFIDLMAIFLLGSWIFAARLRPFLALVIVLGLRQTMQALVALPTPPESIWHYPGFPSLLVTYNVGNDYFFSGHTAIAVLAAVELARFRRAWSQRLVSSCWSSRFWPFSPFAPSTQWTCSRGFLPRCFRYGWPNELRAAWNLRPAREVEVLSWKAELHPVRR